MQAILASRNAKINSQKVLLADATKRHWGLHQGLQRLLGFKGSLPQILRKSPIVACSNSSIEKSINKLYYKPFNLSQLKKWQLQLNTCHYWLFYKNSTLWTNPGHNQYIGSSKNDYQCGYTSSQSFVVNCYWLRLVIHIKILVFVMLLPRNQKKLSIAFHPQINGQTKRQNNLIEAYLKIFVNWEQINWTRLLPMAEFAYNNVKNASINYTLFKLNYSYYLRVSFEENVDFCLRSHSIDKLAQELRELIKICCQNLLYVQEL